MDILSELLALLLAPRTEPLDETLALLDEIADPFPFFDYAVSAIRGILEGLI